MDVEDPLPVPIDIMPRANRNADEVDKDFRSQFILRKRTLVQGNTKSIPPAPSSSSTAPKFTTSSPSSDIDYNPKITATDNNQSPPVTDPEVDEILEKDTNISDEDTSPDHDQAIIEELFLQMGDRAICERMTKRAVARTCKFFCTPRSE